MPSIRSYLIKPSLGFIGKGLSPTRSVEKQRSFFEQLTRTFMPVRGTRIEQRTLPQCSAEWLMPKGFSGSDHVLLYLHGGGYVVGTPKSYRGIASNYAKHLNCPVLVPHYRLAPEQPFPAALDDAYDAWHYLLQSGYKPEQILLAGDSAGGGLSTALLLKLRDAGELMPVAAFVISPLLDLTFTGDSFTSRQKRDPLLRTDWLQWGAAAYAGNLDPKTPYLSPIFSEPTGLPPMLIHVGTEEVLYDDAVRFAALAKKVGVDVQLEEWPGMWHDWHTFAAVLPEARQAVKDSSRWMLEQLRAKAKATR